MNKTKRKNNKNNLSVFVSFSCWRLSSFIKLIRKSSNNTTKRHLRADGLSLLPSALRPRLVGISVTIVGILGLSSSFFTTPASAASLTLTVPSNALSLDISPTSGITFKKSDASTIKVATDDNHGYSLSIKSKTSSDLINGDSKISTIFFQLNESDYQNGQDNINTWGYLPSKLNSVANSNYIPAPTSEPTTLDVTSSSSEGTEYDFALAAKIDSTIPIGNYSNTFVITAVSNTPPVPTTMQEFGSYCDEMTENQSLTLTDTRDNNQYTVAKLKDGKCWMTQNLRIIDKVITQEDSDIDNGTFTIPASNKKFEDNDSSEVASRNQNNAYYDEADAEASGDGKGGFYTWYTATAGSGDASIINENSARNSICPKGWHLPSRSDYAIMGLNYPSYQDIFSSSGPNFITGGYYAGGYLTNSNTAFYWTSTSNHEKSEYYDMYVFTFGVQQYVANITPKTILLSQIERRNSGQRVRCIADPKTEYKINYNLNGGELNNAFIDYGVGTSSMLISSQTPRKGNSHFIGWCDMETSDSSCSGKIYQPRETYPLSNNEHDINLYAIWGQSVEPQECQNIPNIGQTSTFRDPRDNNSYTIARLKDGKCWMTQNLRIIGRTINASNSNMDSGSFTIPSSSFSGFGTGESYRVGAYYANNTTNGVYYTQGAAHAGDTLTAKGEDSQFPGPVETSICPKGWKLPSVSEDYGEEGDFDRLKQYYGTLSQISASPANFVLSGYIDHFNKKLLDGLDAKKSGGYWASTRGNSLLVSSEPEIWNEVSILSTTANYGLNVRCIAEM